MRPENLAFSGFSVLTWTVAIIREVDVAAYTFCYFIVIGLGLFLLKHGRPQREIMLFQIAFCIFLGPLGAISGAVVAAAGHLRKQGDTEALRVWYRNLSGRSKEPPARDIARDIETGRLRPQAKITPKSAQELLLNGTPREKREILTWIARRRDPVLRPLLEIAVQGGDPTIRSQAASILFRLRSS